jgi:hypothetical protein
MSKATVELNKIWYWGVSAKIVDVFKFWLKSANNKGPFMWRPTCVSVFSLGDYIITEGATRIWPLWMAWEFPSFFCIMTACRFVGRYQCFEERWIQYVFLKWWYLPTNQYSVTTQNIFNALTISNLTTVYTTFLVLNSKLSHFKERTTRF